MSGERKNTYDEHLIEKANTVLACFLRERVTDPRKLADYLGCSIQAVNQYKNGTSFPKVENLIKIAEYYDVSLDHLVRNPDSIITNNEIISTLITYGFSYNAARELSILANHGNRDSAKIRFEALNRLIEETDCFEGILYALWKCLNYSKIVTLYESELMKQGRMPRHEDGVVSADEIYIDADRSMYKDATVYKAQSLLSKIAEKFLAEAEQQKTASGDCAESGEK